MPAKRAKFLVIVSLGTLLCVLGCNFLNIGQGSSLMPVRSLTLTIEKSQREELFDQLRKFADKHSFKLVLTDYEKTEHFLVEIWGENILISATDDPGSSRLVSIFFSGKYPGYPVDEETVDDLVIDLKSFISEIPNVTIVEQ
jgi:hypothetical protein